MAPQKLVIFLDPITYAVLRAYANSRGQILADAVAALLYRQAATMSGWPGQAGREIENAMLAAALPVGDVGDEEDLDQPDEPLEQMSATGGRQRPSDRGGRPVTP